MLKNTKSLPPPKLDEVQGEVQYTVAPMSQGPADDLFHLIIETHRRRDDLLRASMRLTLQMKGLCRRLLGGPFGVDNCTEADKLFRAAGGSGTHALAAETGAYLAPLFAARAAIDLPRLQVEKELRLLGKRLPIWEAWAKGVRGIGALGLAQIVAEAGGRLSRFGSVEKLWMRFGVGIDPVLGGIQRRVPGASAGYSPRRRAVLHVIGDAAMKAGGPYREIYLARKAFEVNKAEAAGLKVVPAREIPEGTPSVDYMSRGHIHNRALRYSEKLLLRDLWKKWRDLERGTNGA